MDKEVFLSGYCRTIDQRRMVCAEVYDDAVTADCAYPNCPYAPACEIGKNLDQLKMQ